MALNPPGKKGNRSKKYACYFPSFVLYSRLRLKKPRSLRFSLRRAVDRLARLRTCRRKTREASPVSSGIHTWGIGTVGSALHSHCRGQGFDSPMLHKETLRIKACKVSLYPFFITSEYANPAHHLLNGKTSMRLFSSYVNGFRTISKNPLSPTAIF